MANPITQIIITAVDKTKAAFGTVKKSLFGISYDAKKAGSDLSGVGSSISGMFTKLGLSFAALYNIRALGGILDDFSNLQARLKLASRSTEEYNAANEDLVRISTAAKVPISETATLYTRIAAAVKDLGVSQGDIAGTTEAMALALRLSGASAAESSSAMLQFSQAMASGVLRGEEFNAVNESAPRLMQALAASLKVPVGQLREMAKEGKLTSDVLINGLINQLPTLRKEAESLPGTFGSAFTELKNQLFRAAGAMDDATEASKGLSSGIAAIGGAGIKALVVAAGTVVYLFKEAGRTLGGLVAQMAALAKLDLKGFKSISTAMSEDADAAQKKFAEFLEKILSDEKSANAEREKSSNDIRDINIKDREAEAKASKESIKEQIRDAKQRETELKSAFSASIKAEKDYLSQAKKLRAEANGSETVGDDPESQAAARLDAVTAAMRLNRTAGTDSLESTQDQAEALRNLADQLDDVTLKTDLRRQANLAEATALEKSAAAEKQQSKSLGEQYDISKKTIDELEASLKGAGKEVSIDVKMGPKASEVLSQLDAIHRKIIEINQTPLDVQIGKNISADLSKAALQFGRRQ